MFSLTQKRQNPSPQTAVKSQKKPSTASRQDTWEKTRLKTENRRPKIKNATFFHLLCWSRACACTNRSFPYCKKKKRVFWNLRSRHIKILRFRPKNIPPPVNLYFIVYAIPMIMPEHFRCGRIFVQIACVQFFIYIFASSCFSIPWVCFHMAVLFGMSSNSRFVDSCWFFGGKSNHISLAWL